MTARFRKKVRKWRGRTSHGHGAKKKARGGGSLGGRGFAGLHKHKYSSVTTGSLDYEFGYKGFHSRKKKVKAINVGELEKISKENEIDLTALGYSKLLSRGNVNRALTIKVNSATGRAQEKIEKQGGKIIIMGESRGGRTQAKKEAAQKSR
jgi:large subunit ribosomal protein L15